VRIPQGLAENWEGIQGFEDAWKDESHPVYTWKDHSSWKFALHKYPRYHYNFLHGDAYFTIPKYPFRGEVGGYNFFISNEVWKWFASHGKLSPKHSFTVVNANDRFCQHFDEADKFIKENLKKHGIKVEYGWNLVGTDMATQLATFENVETKERVQRPYNNLYAMGPSKPHQNLVESSLATADSNWQLDVDRETLRHKKYTNIFGLGDVNNLPTTKTFWSGWHQLHVVRNNVLRSLHGQTLNAKYTGWTKSPILLGQNTLTYITHTYDNKAANFNLIDKSGGLISRLRYYYWAKFQKRKFLGYYLFKTWGPPTFKVMRRFQATPGGKEAQIDPAYKAINRATDAHGEAPKVEKPAH